MVYVQPKKKFNPNEIHWFESKFNNLKYLVLRKHRFKHHSQTDAERDIEIEGIYLIKEIEDYGFRFFSQHYLIEKMNDLESIAQQM